MSDALMSQGLDLMVFGMGTVFTFLTILVFSTRLMSHLIVKFFPEPVAVAAPTIQPTTSGTPTAVEPRVLAILQAAINEHRSKKN